MLYTVIGIGFTGVVSLMSHVFNVVVLFVLFCLFYIGYSGFSGICKCITNGKKGDYVIFTYNEWSHCVSHSDNSLPIQFN